MKQEEVEEEEQCLRISKITLSSRRVRLRFSCAKMKSFTIPARYRNLVFFMVLCVLLLLLFFFFFFFFLRFSDYFFNGFVFGVGLWLGTLMGLKNM